MSYADDLLDNSPVQKWEGFTNYKHWKVVQTGKGGTTNWFASLPEASHFAAGIDAKVEGISCETFESAWPWREPHIHGASSDGERQVATEPTPRSDARRSQRRVGVSSIIKRSANFRTAMSNSAERRRCPNCQRKSALVRFNDEWGSGHYCRWDDCRYGDYRPFALSGDTE